MSSEGGGQRAVGERAIWNPRPDAPLPAAPKTGRLRTVRLSHNRASRKDAKKVAGGEPRSGAAPGHDDTCKSPEGGDRR